MRDQGACSERLADALFREAGGAGDFGRRIEVGAPVGHFGVAGPSFILAKALPTEGEPDLGKRHFSGDCGVSFSTKRLECALAGTWSVP
jgi:hypothetical protein